MVLTRRLMNIQKKPRRIDRMSGGRSKKVSLVGQKKYDDKNIKRPTKGKRDWD